jgi:hypothetical protein
MLNLGGCSAFRLFAGGAVVRSGASSRLEKHVFFRKLQFL